MSSDGSAPGDGPPEERRTPPDVPDRPWVAPSERRADEPLTTTDELPIIPASSTQATPEPDLSVRAAPQADGTTRPYPPQDATTRAYPVEPAATAAAGGPGPWAADPPQAGGPVPPAQPGRPGEPVPRRANPVGVVAFVLGIVALIMAVLPIASFFAGVPAIAAIVLGIIGLVLAARRRAFAAVGLVLGAVALVIAIAFSTVQIVGFVRDRVSELPQISDFPSTFPSDLPSGALPTPGGGSLSKGPHTVVYRVTGKGTAAVTYSTFANGTGANARDPQATLPLTRTQHLTVTSGTTQEFVLAAITLKGKARLGCSIEVDGKVIAHNSSSASSGVELVTCTGRTAPF